MGRKLIYLDDAIGAANRADYTGLAVEDVKKVTDEVVKELKKLPSAQPEPSQVARDIATIIENEKDMRVIAEQPIRCKDCRYAVKGQDADDWFCANGNRKEAK